MAISAPAPKQSRQIPRLKHGSQLYRAVTISKSPKECFEFVRNPENLSLFIKGFQAVTPITSTKWHCATERSNGRTIEWNVEITNELPSRLIAWRSEKDAPVTHAGSVRFEPAPPGRGTEVQVSFEFDQPMGRSILAKVSRAEPVWELEDDLIRLKMLLEAGEIATIDGQSRGPKK